MKKQLLSRIAMALACLLALAGCGGKPAAGPSLRWESAAITGTRYYYRQMGSVTVHYAAPTMPDQAEVLGTMVNQLLDWSKGWGRLRPGDRLDLWVVPAGSGWPQGVPAPTPTLNARAVKPHVVLVSDVIPAQVPVLNGRLIYPDMPLNANGTPQYLPPSFMIHGLSEAVAVAVTQGESSAAYGVDWIHDGMGALFTANWQGFPVSTYTRPNTSFKSTNVPWSTREIMARVNSPQTFVPAPDSNIAYVTYREAVSALAGLLVDRFGINWPMTAQRSPDELSPLAAIRWATGAATDQEGLDLFDKRMQQIATQVNPKSATASVPTPTLADQGANRARPASAPGKGAGASDPPSYRLNVRLDPATYTVSGTEELTWISNAAGPLDQLYFNVWGNADFMQRMNASSAIDAVAVNGAASPFTFREMDLQVPLSKALGPGERVTVELHFSTRLTDQTSVSTKPVPGMDTRQLAVWFPTLAALDEHGWRLDSYLQPDGKLLTSYANVQLQITVPQGTQVQAPGPAPKVTVSGTDSVYDFPTIMTTGWWPTLLIPQADQ